MWRDGHDVLKPYKDAHTEELDFCLKLDHYRDQDADYSKDRRRIKPRTADLFSIVRHKSAEISRNEIYLDVRPIPNLQDTGPMDEQRTDEIEMGAELAEIALNRTIHHPRFGYEDPRDMMVLAGLAGRVGCACVEFDPRKRPYGELVFRNVDFRRLAWTPGTKGPHDPRCWWLIEEKDMTPEEIQGMKRFGWKQTDDILTTSEGDTKQAQDSTLPPGAVRLSTQGLTEPNKSKRTKFVKVLFRWILEDDTSEVDPEQYQEMDPSDYYLACPDCGYEEHPAETGENLPKSASCPICSGTMHRVEMKASTVESLSYPEGRLTICTEEGPEITFYDGDTDCPTRSFRYITWESYPHPYEPVGLSDTKLHWNMQLIVDSSYRLAYEQMSENRHLLITLEDGLVDANGEPWMFSDAQGRVAYAKDMATLGSIRDFQGQAVPPGWSEFIGQLRNAFVPNFGTTDIYLDPGNSKNIPVGTLERMQQSKELPVQHHITRLQRRESIFFGVVLDMIRFHWSDRRWVDYEGEDGKVDYKYLQGASLPDCNVMVTAAPIMAKIEQDQAQSLQIVAQMFSQNPVVAEVFAQTLGVSPDKIAKIKKGLADQAQQSIDQAILSRLKGAVPPELIMMLAQHLNPQGAAGGPPVPPGASTLQGGPQSNLAPQGPPAPVGAPQ